MKGQFVTNTTLFGTQIAAASIEMIDGKQTQNLFATVIDSHGNKGYLKSVPTESEEKEIKGNMLGKRLQKNKSREFSSNSRQWSLEVLNWCSV